MGKSKMSVEGDLDGAANKAVGAEGSRGIQDLSYLDLFPYNPNYSFHGFRSLPGTFASLLFLFCVWLRVITTGSVFYESTPIVLVKKRPIDKLDEDQEIQDRLNIAVKLTDQLNLPIMDKRYFRVHFELGILSGPNRVTYYPLANETRSDFTTGNSLIRYEDLIFVRDYIPDDDGVTEPTKVVLRGDLPLATFKFVRIRVEQCMNTTVWDPRLARFTVVGSTTAGDQVCRSQSDIDDLAANSGFNIFITETNLDPDKWDSYSTFLFTMQRDFKLNTFLRHQFFIDVTRVTYLSRYVFDDRENDNRYYQVSREDESLSDQVTVTGVDGNEHMYRMEYIFRLDRMFSEQTRDHLSIYGLFESWAGSCVFFAFTFGIMGWLYNRHAFKEQTRGLDIRKMDRDQFDRFGRLVDKSFQMPRELQDMQAE